jgi:hypothetical protein
LQPRGVGTGTARKRVAHRLHQLVDLHLSVAVGVPRAWDGVLIRCLDRFGNGRGRKCDGGEIGGAGTVREQGQR